MPRLVISPARLRTTPAQVMTNRHHRIGKMEEHEPGDTRIERFVALPADDVAFHERDVRLAGRMDEVRTACLLAERDHEAGGQTGDTKGQEKHEIDVR